MEAPASEGLLLLSPESAVGRAAAQAIGADYRIAEVRAKRVAVAGTLRGWD